MPELKVRIGCVVLAIIMSAVTYHFVEPRLRWGRFGGLKAAGLLSVMAVIGVTGYLVERHDGYTARMNDPEQQVIDAINKRLGDDSLRCLNEIPDQVKLMTPDRCMLQRGVGENTIAIIGDSHAGHLYSGLSALAKENEGIAVFPPSSQVPLIGLQDLPLPPEPFPYVAEGFDYILSHSNITKVLLAHHPLCSWHQVMDKVNPDNNNFDSILRDGFLRTYDTLTKAGKEIYVVWDNPVYVGDQWLKCQSSVINRPSVIPSFLTSKNTKLCTVKQDELPEREIVDNWRKVSSETASGYKNVHFIDLEEFFCSKGVCSMLDRKGNLLYRDGSHLNQKGSMSVAPFIYSKLRGTD